MYKNKINAAIGLGIISVSTMLVGCMLGEPSTADIESSLRQNLILEAKQETDSSRYIEFVEKNLKLTVLKNNGCKPSEDKAYVCNVSAEFDLPEYSMGNGFPKLEAIKKSADVKVKLTRAQNGWVAEEIK